MRSPNSLVQFNAVLTLDCTLNLDFPLDALQVVLVNFKKIDDLASVFKLRSLLKERFLLFSARVGVLHVA